MNLMSPIILILITNLSALTFAKGSLLFLTLTWNLLWFFSTLVLFSDSDYFTVGVLFFILVLCMAQVRVPLSSISQKLREQMHILGLLAFSIFKRRSGFETAPQPGELCVFNHCVGACSAFKNVTDWTRDVERLSNHDTVPAIMTRHCYGAFAGLWINSEAGEGGQGKSELNPDCKHRQTIPPNAMNKLRRFIHAERIRKSSRLRPPATKMIIKF